MPHATTRCRKPARDKIAHEYLSVFASSLADVVLPPTAGSLAQVVPPMAGTQAQTLRVGVVAYQYSVAELVAAAPADAINCSLGGQTPKKIAGLLRQYCCRAAAHV